MWELLLEGSNFLDRMSQPNVIIGIVLAAVGLALTLLAKRITRVIRKEQKIDEGDRVYLALKAFSLVMILVALIVMIVK
ncbi:MAG: hypothetical protein RR400_03790 [Clostridia bacterium]